MIVVRIGNDVRIKWEINQVDGTPENFNGAKIRTSIRRGSKYYDIPNKIIDNVLHIDFLASEQRIPGIYDLVACWTKPDSSIRGGKASYTIDKCEAVELVKHDCDLEENDLRVNTIIGQLSYSYLAESEKTDIIQRLLNGGLWEDFDTAVIQAINSANTAANFANEKGEYAESKGNTAQSQGNTAEQKGNTAEQQGDIAEQKGLIAEQQGNTAQNQGSTAEQKGNYAKTQGDYAKEKGELVADVVDNESERLQAESERISNEQTRISQENSRVSAENIRITSEITRGNNEDDRIGAENVRISNEDARIGAESERLSAEIIRQSNEGERIDNEATRVQDEAERISEEGIRQSNETDRVEAEGIRVQAEVERQNTIQEAVTATNLANEKANLANDAAQSANEAADSALTATQEATTAALLADAARLAIQDDLELKANQTDLAQLESEVNLKEVKASKQNSLAADGTGTKFPTVDAVNEGLAGVNNLIASYTHSGNLEVHCTAVDLATGTFTAIGHGLSDGNIIFPILNKGYLEYNFGILRPFPTGLALAGYFVVNSTVDTFQISGTQDGVAKTFTENANLDLTAFRFERNDTWTVTITNVTEKNTRIEFKGWVFATWQVQTVRSPGSTPNNPYNFSKYTFLGEASVNSAGNSYLAYASFLDIHKETRIGENSISIWWRGLKIAPNTQNANTLTNVSNNGISLFNGDVDIDRVYIGGSASGIIANGTEIRIYKI